jgi:hypothetical protein
MRPRGRALTSLIGSIRRQDGGAQAVQAVADERRVQREVGQR